MTTMEKIVSLAKRRGFIFPSSEIYGGLGGVWDYGPLGVALKQNVKRAWWRDTVLLRDDVVGLDAAILMHPKVWEASGHVTGFTDPLVDCRSCKKRFRADHLLEALEESWKRDEHGAYEPNDLADLAMHLKNVPCPECGARSLTEPRQFNLMFKTFVGPVEDDASRVWLRPETAQGIFVNFKNVLDVTGRRLPLGIAQIGKSFRNEITPGHFTYRSREFEQMELEFFVKPGTDREWYEYWVSERFSWYERYGLRRKHLRIRPHGRDELSHYSVATSDIEYEFPFGWAELEGIANRTDFDLTQHITHSGKDLRYFDETTKERYVPYVIEPSSGVDRAMLAFLVDAYTEEKIERTDDGGGERETRAFLRLHPHLAPVSIAVFPLLANRPQLVERARAIFETLRQQFVCAWDDIGNIGKRYRRQDEIGTPYCVTVDYETLDDGTVTVRDRDTMAQERVAASELSAFFAERFSLAPH